MTESTTLPRHADRAINMDDQRKRQYSVLNDMFLLILFLLNFKEVEAYDDASKAMDIVSDCSYGCKDSHFFLERKPFRHFFVATPKLGGRGLNEGARGSTYPHC